eukprot:maker-scaffold263_size232787-snap-gene-1.27 protein:Tk11207 transcript:maker-scaffold263_size232787-snap-gene-1.27-mRNA-1 annotation:"PREDICTED: uncharacterized protein LOC100905060 isoform 1"
MYSIMDTEPVEFGEFPDLFSNDLLDSNLQECNVAFEDPSGLLSINEKDDIEAMKQGVAALGDILDPLTSLTDIIVDSHPIQQEVPTQDLSLPTTWFDQSGIDSFLVPDSPASTIEEVSLASDDTQQLIAEMEDFLVAHECQASPEAPESIADEPAMDNNQVLDDLMNGNVAIKSPEDHAINTFKDMEQTLGMSINNVSEFMTEDGQKIVIVIANDLSSNVPSPSPSLSRSQSPLAEAASPTPSSLLTASPRSMGSQSPAYSDDTADSDWSPAQSDLRPKMTRNRANRGPYKRPAQYNVKDKKERKKLQNVEAARRYRDKKKVEQITIEDVEGDLMKTNESLKSQMSDLEGEVKTLKKLMLELGLIKA